MHKARIVYKEALPLNCPPVDASPLINQPVLRLVSSAHPTAKDFLSYAALGKPLNEDSDIDDCCHASCSCFLYNPKLDRGKSFRKLPKLAKRKFVAILNLDTNSGVAQVKHASGHVDLWMYASFDPLAAIQKVEAL